MKIQSNIPDLKILINLINEEFGHTLLNYGEAVEVITENQGANFVAGQNPCAITDAYKSGIFFVRRSASPTDQNDGGYFNRLSRKVDFALAGFSKEAKTELEVAILINQVPGIEYQGSNFDSKQIARQYFGLEEVPFQLSIFSIDFSVVETLTCLPC